MTDERIEAFLQEVLSNEGVNSNEIREATRIYLAEYERMFRDAELDEPEKTQAAERCRALCRARVVEEMSRCKGTSTEAHLKIVLEVIDGPARFPQEPG
jgi:hypothetical protein